MKKTFTSTLVLLSALMLTACSEGNTGKSISEDKATDIALKDAKLSKKKCLISKLSLTKKTEKLLMKLILIQTKRI
ncbi:hypothetical protein ABG808_06980 [Streptococcus iniae]